ncbi:MAG TPA: RdgB/HAM1 family non-canonical purine NTP pyrophosphatase [Vicinamibacterales bacterium]|nr:RdgB/HAM1 family non-canonical purine NTP pyrophosphatase [Vicinamibacterales bacterium]
MKLLVATTNQHKLREIAPLLAGADLDLITLSDVEPVPEPEETGATFWENARQKALAYARATGLVTVAEDSGLVVEALGGEPGVRSARFLGANVSYPARFDEIYRRLATVPGERHAACFVTALVMADGGSIVYETESRIEGVIAPRPAGSHGFGYDPIFLYPPLARTTAEMTSEEKAAVSHRARAFRDLRRALAADRVAILGG